MKRVILLATAMMFIAGQVWAGPTFGVKGGLNLANMSVDPSNNVSYGMRTGILVGGNVEFALSSNDKITLRGEALYVMKGTKATYTVNGMDVKETDKTDELVLAPFLVIRFPSEGFTPFIQAGPELGLNVTHSYKAEGTQNGQTQSQSGDLKDWGSTDFSLNFGAGILIPAGDGEVLFDLRYNLGLSNMYTGPGSTTAKNDGVQICIGYNFKKPTKR
jgi:hypothetical protein